MSSLVRLLSRVASAAFFGLLSTFVVSAGAQSSQPPTLTFGSVAVGQSSTMVFTANTARNTLRLDVGSEYAISTQTCVPDPNGGFDCTVGITFTPKAPGLLSDAVLSPNDDGVDTVVEYLSGTGTAPQLGFDFGSAGTALTVGGPNGVAIGPDGSIYVTSGTDDKVYRFNKDGSGRTDIDFAGFGLQAPAAIAVDGLNAVYVADTTKNAVYSIGLNGLGRVIADNTTVSGPVGLAVDGAGSVYVADAGNSRIIKVDLSANTTVVASELSTLVGIAIDGSGNLYYAQGGTINQVTKIPAAGGSNINLGQSYVGTITGIAVDAAGAVYVSATGGAQIITSNQVIQEFLGSGGPVGIAVDEQGDIYEAFHVTGAGSVAIFLRNTGVTYLYAMVGDSTEQQILIQNTGNTPLLFSNFAFDKSVFAVDPDGTTCVANSPVAPGAACDLLVAFNPTSPQIYAGTLTVTSNSLNGTTTTNQYMLNGQTPQSSTVFSVSANPSTAGQSLTFTAVVSGNFYNGTGFQAVPTAGTVDFIDSNNNILGSGTIVTNSSGSQATFTTSSLAPGDYSIRARYNGSTTVGGSISPVTTVFVNPSTQPTTTSLAVSSSTIVHRQPETLTATIAGASGPALSGSVSFFAGTNLLTTVPLTVTSAGGTATYTTTSLGIGTQSLTAVYSGDANYVTSTSPAQQVIVQGPATATISLAASPTTVPYRMVTRLTATVLNGSGTPVTSGQVYFCDLSASLCNATYNLGTSQLNPSGVAVLQLAPGTVGAHPFVAILLGTNAYLNATSSTQTVTVSGTYSTTAILSSSGAPGNYSLTAAITAPASRPAAPAGQVSFRDLTNPVTPSLGTATLGAPTFAFATTQATGSPNTVGRNPYGIATGDFNGDGVPDVVTGNYTQSGGPGTVSVLIGNGDGTFVPAVSYPVGMKPERVLVADFNGDGYADLVVANTGSGSLGILINNGNGTFKPQVTYPVSSPVGLGVMDLNNDGIADLAVGDYYSNTMSILIGNGDGTFQAALTYPTGNTPQTLAEGDFNGDGYVDIAVGNFADNTVGIFFNKGDGTFSPQITYAVGHGPQGIQVGDFDHDGFEDLAVSNSGDGTISILLNNADGTFKPQVTYAVGNDPVGLVIADFNGDGFQDLSTGNTAQSDLTQSILLGNGDGTFQPQIVVKTGNFPYGEAAADFDGDGFPDLAIANFNDSTATILLSQVSATSTASITGISLGSPVGTHNINASYPVTGNFGAVNSADIQLISAGSTSAATATTLAIAPGAATVGQSVVFSVAVAGTTQTTPVPTGTITLASTGSASLGNTTITLGANGTGSFSTTQIPVGTYAVTATYSGDTNYAASVSAPQTLTVSLVTQTITFPAIATHTIEDAPFTLTATASSGLAVTYSIVSGPATISGNTVTLAGTTGTVVIQASQAGNSTYAAASSVTRSFTVSGASVPTLTAITPSAIVTGSTATTITLTGTNFNSVDVVRLNGAGTIATTFVNATTLTAVIPASALVTAGTIQVAVNDLIGKTTSNVLTITVSNTPAVVFTGPTTPPASGQQPTLTFQLTNPYPVPLTASFNLLFTPAVTPAVDDPAIQFANGGRNYTFTVAANSIVTPAIQLQAGTEAGTITVPVTLTAQGVDVTPANLTPVVLVIPAAAPVVNVVTMNASGSGVNVVITGYSNTREATQAKFHFTAAPGAELNTPDFTANISPLFSTWYGSAASAPYGSTVVYTQSFSLDSGAASTITGVTVTLTNSVGTSNTGSSQ